ncbi:Uncharacterized protein TCM_016263 [Theobroma cacao]|uniref:Uncharacterized protein n=1 Tax=Theobroma cacao TaxID=3641 RepID=A0A061G6F5_THECC|nr:Uncharacterized protein TCM_016263 [Theobroma cacao]
MGNGGSSSTAKLLGTGQKNCSLICMVVPILLHGEDRFTAQQMSLVLQWGVAIYQNMAMMGNLPTSSRCKYGTMEILFIQMATLLRFILIDLSATMHRLLTKMVLPIQWIFSMGAPATVNLYVNNEVIRNHAFIQREKV